MKLSPRFLPLLFLGFPLFAGPTVVSVGPSEMQTIELDGLGPQAYVKVRNYDGWIFVEEIPEGSQPSIHLHGVQSTFERRPATLSVELVEARRLKVEVDYPLPPPRTGEVVSLTLGEGPIQVTSRRMAIGTRINPGSANPLGQKGKSVLILKLTNSQLGHVEITGDQTYLAFTGFARPPILNFGRVVHIVGITPSNTQMDRLDFLHHVQGRLGWAECHEELSAFSTDLNQLFNF